MSQADSSHRLVDYHLWSPCQVLYHNAARETPRTMALTGQGHLALEGVGLLPHHLVLTYVCFVGID